MRARILEECDGPFAASINRGDIEVLVALTSLPKTTAREN
jgi:hypothetical protein